MMINLNSINLGSINLGGMNTSEIKLGYPSSGCPVPGLKGLQGFYMGKGLTNEMMSRDPVWRDKSGKGNHIQLKNFAWAKKSGVGMYPYNFKEASFVLSSNYGSKTDNKVTFSRVNNAVSFRKYTYYGDNTFKCKIKVSGLDTAILNGEIKSLKIYDNVNDDRRQDIFNDGIYDINYTANEGATAIYFYLASTTSYPIPLQEPVIIEQIPTYENALCFDGVDDYGICETFPILTKEKGYTVMALYNIISYKDMTFFLGKSTYYTNGAFLTGRMEENPKKTTASYGATSVVDYSTPSNFFYQTSTSFNDQNIEQGPGEDNEGLVIGRTYLSSGNYANIAAYALAIFDHDTTAEERQPVIDYWKKEYPELFPDQAWTVTGKTNSDDDRATIKNITGNGNDLVLTNFGYAENSGYGLYYQNFNFVYINNATHGTISKNYKSFTWTALINYPVNNSPTYWGSGRYVNKRFGIILSSNLPDFKITLRWSNKENAVVRDQELHLGYNLIDAFTDEDFDSLSTLSPGTRIVTPMSPDDWFTLEQVPDYEGYLVTDGVDDQIVSGVFDFGDKWTIVGEWEFLQEESNKLAGIIKSNSFHAYNYVSGVFTYIYNPVGTLLKNTHSIKAATSEGTVYVDFNSAETKVPLGDLEDRKYQLQIGHNNGKQFTKLAFKNLAIYNRILSKEQCIRAYNYLQTIKNN